MLYTDGYRVTSDKNVEELHKWAEKNGVKRYWYSSRKQYPFYTFPTRRLSLARAKGLRQVTREEWTNIASKLWIATEIKRYNIRHKFRIGQDVMARPYHSDGDDELFHCRVKELSVMRGQPAYTLHVVSWERDVEWILESGVRHM